MSSANRSAVTRGPFPANAQFALVAPSEGGPPPAMGVQQHSSHQPQRPTQRPKKIGRNSSIKAAKKPRIVIPPLPHPGAVVKAIRPLNSWIAYRCYYSPMFASLQQKDISGFLTNLWRGDPFKLKWTVLAKAYSIIRDVRGKRAAPLNLFLALNAPFMSIIPPSEYLDLLGWEMYVSDAGERAMRRRFTPDLCTFDSDIVSDEHSVHDVIRHSRVQGYIPADGAEFDPARSGSSPLTQQVIAVSAAFKSLSDVDADAKEFRLSSSPMSTYNPDTVSNEHSSYDVVRQGRVQDYIPADREEFNLALPGSSPLTQQVIAVSAALEKLPDVSADAQEFRPSSSHLSTYDSEIIRDEHSVHDVVRHGRVQGYTPTNRAEFDIAPPGSSPLTERVIAVSAAFESLPSPIAEAVPVTAPTTVTSPASSVEHLGVGSRRRVTGAVGRSHFVTPGYLEVALRAELAQERDEVMAEAAAIEAEQEKQRLGPGHGLFDKFRNSGTAYPHLAHFAANDDDNGDFDLNFDPFKGDAWDTYDVSDYINSTALGSAPRHCSVDLFPESPRWSP
ncbi:MAG: hypothetical protein M1832_006393 [Thelocarpon impressellum]|nr:MAG: hypothetical protein M1832_006393 [Thelocarpon impressellum]